MSTMDCTTTPRRHGPLPRTQADSGAAYRALAVVRRRVALLFAAGKVAAADAFVAPLLADFEAVAPSGDPSKLRWDAAIADDLQDVARLRYQRGEITPAQYLHHLQQQHRYTLAEMRDVRARMHNAD